MRKKMIGFRNMVQVALFEEELKGQINENFALRTGLTDKLQLYFVGKESQR